MKVLPPRTMPPTTVVERRHAPRQASYPTYRPCLRWEFGHGCAFCLTHEADLMEHGVEGTGQMGIEHQVPRSRDGKRADDYTNCFYACRFCNQARGRQANVDPAGHRLLDPCHSAWSDHFVAVEDRLIPRRDDLDAERTHRVYDLDDPRKRVMRQRREELLAQALEVLHDGPLLLARLLDAAQAPGVERAGFLGEARLVRDYIIRAKRDLERFAIPPKDADVICNCSTTAACTLPVFLKVQSITIAS